MSAKTSVEDKVSLLLGGAVYYKTLLYKGTAGKNHRRSAHSSRLSNNYSHLSDIQLNTTSCEVSVANHPVKLTRTEYALLKLLMQHPTQVMVKSLLLERISEDTPDCTESSLKMHMSNLRKKLREINGKDYIEAVWGIGFKMKEE